MAASEVGEVMRNIENLEGACRAFAELARCGDRFTRNPQLKSLLEFLDRVADTTSNSEALKAAIDNVRGLRQAYGVNLDKLITELGEYDGPQAILECIEKFTSGIDRVEAGVIIPDPLPIRASELAATSEVLPPVIARSTHRGMDLGVAVYRTSGSSSRVEIGYSHAFDAGDQHRLSPRRGRFGLSIQSGAIERPCGFGLLGRVRGRVNERFSVTIEKGVTKGSGAYAIENMRFHNVIPHLDLSIGALAEEARIGKLAVLDNSTFFLMPTLSTRTPNLVPTVSEGGYLMPILLKKSTAQATAQAVKVKTKLEAPNVNEGKVDGSLNQDSLWSNEEELVDNNDLHAVLTEEGLSRPSRNNLQKTVPGVSPVRVPSTSVLQNPLPTMGGGRTALVVAVMVSTLVGGIMSFWIRKKRQNKKTDD